MADGLMSSGVAILTLFTGVLVVFAFYITKLVTSAVKETQTHVEQPANRKESAVEPTCSGQKKQQPTKQGAGKKKNERKRRESKQNFTHPWLLTSLKGHTAQILDMDISPNGKYLATTAQAEPIAPDPGGGPKTPRRHKKKKPPKKVPPAPEVPPWREHPMRLNEAEIEACLRHYLLTPRQLQSLGYPMESELHPGRAVIFHPFPPHDNVREPRCSDSSSSGSSGSDEAEDDTALTDTSVRSEERRCVRCSRGFFLLKDKYLTTERCVYHWGKPVRHIGYSCCQGADGTAGCVSAKLHVWSGVELGVNGPFSGYVVTQPRKKPPDGYGVYAIDCEMCFTTQGLELCKVSVVDLNGKVVYNTYVKPDSQVIDYNTRFSGVTSKHLQKNSSVKTIKQVQSDILELVSAETILIGHGLENDLKALKIIHRTVVDTAVAFPHHFGLPYRRSLRSLVNSVLQRDIQTASHDSVEDALACIHLMLFRLACDFNHLPIPSL